MTMMLLLAALGCKKDAEDTAVGDDTSVDDTSVVDDTGEEACQVKPSEFAPEDEASEVYYRTEMSMAFTGAVSAATTTSATSATLWQTEKVWPSGGRQALSPSFLGQTP